MSEVTEIVRQRAARSVEIVLGLGVDPAPYCDLCSRRVTACPKHAGEAIVAQLQRDGLLA